MTPLKCLQKFNHQQTRSALKCCFKTSCSVIFDINTCNIQFKDPEYVYLGGYPEELTIKNVTKSKYDGCLDNVKIARVEVKPNNKYVIQAYGYTPGCPVQV